MPLSRHLLPRAKEVIHGVKPELLIDVGIYKDIILTPPNTECSLYTNPLLGT